MTFNIIEHKSNINKQPLTILIHILIWSTVISVSILDISDIGISINFNKISSIFWVFYIITFYTTYLVLIPKFLYKKRNTLFILLSSLLITTTFVSSKAIFTYTYFTRVTADKRVEKTMSNIHQIGRAHV